MSKPKKSKLNATASLRSKHGRPHDMYFTYFAEYEGIFLICRECRHTVNLGWDANVQDARREQDKHRKQSAINDE